VAIWRQASVSFKPPPPKLSKKAIRSPQVKMPAGLSAAVSKTSSVHVTHPQASCPTLGVAEGAVLGLVLGLVLGVRVGEVLGLAFGVCVGDEVGAGDTLHVRG
jgi:hypothetical protein